MLFFSADHLVPKPTLIAQVALNRTGYQTDVPDEVFTTVADPWGQAACTTTTWSSSNAGARSCSVPGDGGSTSTLDDDFDDWAKMINAELTELDKDIVKYVATGSEIPQLPNQLPDQLPDTSLEVLLNSECFDGLQSNGTIQSLVAPKIEEIPMDSSKDYPISSLAPVDAQNMLPRNITSRPFGNLSVDNFVGDTKPSLIPMDQGGDLSGSKLRGISNPCMFGNGHSTGEPRNFQQNALVLTHLNTVAAPNTSVMNIPQQSQGLHTARDPNTMITSQSRNFGRIPQMPRSADMASTGSGSFRVPAAVPDMTSTGGANFRVPATVPQMPKQNDLQSRFIQELKELLPQDLCYTDEMVVDLVDDMMVDADADAAQRVDNDIKLATILQQAGFAQIEGPPVIKQEVVTPTLPQPSSSFPSFSDTMATQSSQPRVISCSTTPFTSTDTFSRFPAHQTTFAPAPPRRPQNGTVHNQGSPMRFPNGNSQFVSQEDSNRNFLNTLSNAGITSTQTGAALASTNQWNSNAPSKQNAMEQGLRNLLQNTNSAPPKQTTNFNSQINSGLLSQQPNMPFMPQQNVSNMVPQSGPRNTQNNMFNMTVVPNMNQLNFQELSQVNSLLQSSPMQASSFQNLNGTNMSINNPHYTKFDMNRKL